MAERLKLKFTEKPAPLESEGCGTPSSIHE